MKICVKIGRDNVNCETCMCNDSKVMCNLLVTALIFAILLIVRVEMLS